MKIFLLITLVIFGIAPKTKADTIDTWHVYYNKSRIKEFNQFNKQEITIKIDRIKSNDSITVKYYTDRPCPDCDSHLTIMDEKHHAVVICKGKGDGVGNPLSFALKDLLAYKHRSGCNSFEIFYSEHHQSIFSIKFE